LGGAATKSNNVNANSSSPLRKGHRPRQKKTTPSSSRTRTKTFDARTEAFFRVGDTPPPPPPPILKEVEHEHEHPAKERRAPKRNLVPLVSIIVAIAAGLCLFAVVRSSSAAANTTKVNVTLPAPAAIASPPVMIEERPPPNSQEPPLPPTTTALEDREEARALLTKRDVKGAIDVATRSIEADPEDATTYLILGAAQMEALLAKDAAETFKNCIKLAKTGPVAECRAFLR
jgi:hypothetical protein